VISFDVDIDVARRDQALQGIKHVSASLIRNDQLEKHNTGVYFHGVPQDPVTGYCSLPYKQAQEQGWFKIDILNVNVYEKVRSPQHLQELCDREFSWELMTHPEFVSQLVHLHNHADLVCELAPVCIEDIARILALIRPGKKWLINRCRQKGLASAEPEIWQPSDQGFHFKKSHSFGYAMLVKVHAEIIIDEISQTL
tara:strand:- start:9942 stop:10532 length:591 start_codon:yes stop_codon:yes gene_type:complete